LQSRLLEQQMQKGRYLLIIAILLIPNTAILGQSSSETRLFSPSVGQRLYTIAYEIATKDNITREETEQALMLLSATATLDNSANYILPKMIKLSCNYYDGQARIDITEQLGASSIKMLLPETNDTGTQLVYALLSKYLKSTSNLEPARKAVEYLLEQLDSREQREEMLAMLLNNLGGKNDVLDSEFASQIGLMAIEKADVNSAQYYLLKAYSLNKYNAVALDALVSLLGSQIDSAAYLEHLRLMIAENPMNIEAAMAFAEYCEKLQLYDIAAESYQYCAELFNYISPDQALPRQIYLPWSVTCYNSTRKQHQCLQIAQQQRSATQYDLVLETIAAKASEKTSNKAQAKQLLKTVEKQALQLYGADKTAISAVDIAWFYCFALPDNTNALDWANKAYSAEPNSETTAAILAYAFVMNNQFEWAKPLIESYSQSQIALLALGEMQLGQGQIDEASENLKLAIAADAASLEARRARQLLAKNDREYIPETDPDVAILMLKNNFEDAAIPKFSKPEELASFRLSARGGKFFFGSDFGGAVAITNNSRQPLVLSDAGIFTGSLRIDAEVTGDIEQKIPNLVSMKFQSSKPINPGQSKVIPVRLITGKLRDILLKYPQASVQITFTLYIDPVIDNTDKAGQKVYNRFVSIKPSKLTIKRPGVVLTGRFLQNRFNSLTNGRGGQKTRTATLFTALLAEQYAMAGREPLYKFAYADWMDKLLKSALKYNLTDDDWTVKVQTMTDMVTLPLDYELLNAVSENLNDTRWPVRLMAVYLLAKNQQNGFEKVLDWTAEYDSNELVRNMAVALGGKKPSTQQNLNQIQEPNQPQ